MGIRICISEGQLEISRIFRAHVPPLVSPTPLHDNEDRTGYSNGTKSSSWIITMFIDCGDLKHFEHNTKEQ